MTPDRDLHACHVAGILGCSVKTVYKLADKGKLPGYKLGGNRWRFRRADVDAFRRPVHRAHESVPLRSRGPARRDGQQLAGWHDFDHSSRKPS